ncbi:hypothetical protein AOY38_15985 [Synechocystis sp. PCC 6803]|nr:hypothetical protein AOY38_15985 [Synechocystis sp. PCC 6803]AVP91067.1 hypothetical protein C7I86_16140 [Synechocystis sp. IPPAS B-1465]
MARGIMAPRWHGEIFANSVLQCFHPHQINGILMIFLPTEMFEQIFSSVLLCEGLITMDNGKVKLGTVNWP